MCMCMCDHMCVDVCEHTCVHVCECMCALSVCVCECMYVHVCTHTHTHRPVYTLYINIQPPLPISVHNFQSFPIQSVLPYEPCHDQWIILADLNRASSEATTHVALACWCIIPTWCLHHWNNYEINNKGRFDVDNVQKAVNLNIKFLIFLYVFNCVP